MHPSSQGSQQGCSRASKNMDDSQRYEFATDAGKKRLTIREYFVALLWSTLHRLRIVDIDVPADVKVIGHRSMFGHRRL